jgi:hypothetical protein
VKPAVSRGTIRQLIEAIGRHDEAFRVGSCRRTALTIEEQRKTGSQSAAIAVVNDPSRPRRSSEGRCKSNSALSFFDQNQRGGSANCIELQSIISSSR